MRQEVYKVEGNQFTIVDHELGIQLSGVLEQEKSLTNDDGKQRCFYSCGQLHGPSEYFSREGRLLSLTWFFKGMKIGKLHRYYLDGTLYCIERYFEGRPHLTQEYFYPNGQIKTLLRYEHGKYHGKMELFWPSGKLKRECIFIQGVKTQENNIYDQKGNLIHGTSAK